MTVIIIQARMASTRLPGKIMKNLSGQPVLWHVVNRCRKSKKTAQVIVATTINQEDDLVEKWCLENKILYHRGSSENVLERYYQTAEKYGADVIVRITSDCSLIDPGIIDLCLEEFKKGNFDYLSNVIPRPSDFPLGLEVEIFSFAVLEKAYLGAMENYEKEHVTPYIWENKKMEFKIAPRIPAPPGYKASYRLTMDYPEDFELLEKIYEKFYKPGTIINVSEVLAYLDKHPELAKINANCVQKPVKQKEAIVILGGGLVKDGNKWRTTNYNESDEFGCLGDRLRVVAGSYLYQDKKEINKDLLVIASGGRGQLQSIPGAPTLAEVIYKELAALGVAPDRIFKEDQSINTYGQLKELEKLVLQFNLGKVIVISNEYHLSRIKAMIEYIESLVNLRKKLLDASLILESAEKIVIKYDPDHWQKAVADVYQGKKMQERIRLERRGVEQIKSGTYKLK